jgi:uncharacterized protein (DUF433 family)
MNLEDRIVVDPSIRSGKPCIRGTRIAVYDVLEYLAGGMSETELLHDFPISAPKISAPCLRSRPPRAAAGNLARGVKLLLDENLSPRLVDLLADAFPASTHPTQLGIRGTSDQALWDFARPRIHHHIQGDFRPISRKLRTETCTSQGRSKQEPVVAREGSLRFNQSVPPWTASEGDLAIGRKRWNSRNRRLAPDEHTPHPAIRGIR